MTVAVQNNTVVYTGNGVATNFAANFSAMDDGDVEVYLYEIATGDLELVSSSDYNLNGVPGDTFSVDYPLVGSPLAATHKIAIVRIVDLLQPSTFSNTAGFDPATLTLQLDEIVRMIQQVNEMAQRSVKVVLGSGDDPDEVLEDLDAAVAAAQASATAAAASETAAETAETNAETAEAAAEAAQAAAEAAAASINPALFVEIADTNASGFGFVLDEDNMASNSPTKLPTQQSVKAYADTLRSNGPPIVILSTGQSNTALHPTYAWTPEPNVYLWDFDGIVDVAGTDVGTQFNAMDATSMGYAYAYANEVAKANPLSNVYLVNVGEGSQAIAQWMVGAGAPDMYDACKDNIEAALTLLGLDTIDHFLWWQGESDAIAGSTTYLANFETVIARFRAETWFPLSTPITIMGVSILYAADPLVKPFNTTQARSAAVEPEIRKYIYTGFLPVAYWDTAGSGNIHMTAAGYEQAGKLAYGGLRAVNSRFYIDPETGSGHLIDSQTLLRHFISNTNAAGSAGYYATSSQGTLLFLAFGTALPNSAQLAWDGAGTLFIGATNAAGNIVFQTGGTGTSLAIAANGNVQAAAALRTSGATSGIGYATGAGGTVTQLTSKATGVTLSKVSGQITMNNAALAAATIVSFTLTNTAIAAGDTLVLNHVSGGTLGAYTLNAACGAGSATITLRNNTAGSLSEAVVIGFTLIKGVTS